MCNINKLKFEIVIKITFFGALDPRLDNLRGYWYDNLRYSEDSIVTGELIVKIIISVVNLLVAIFLIRLMRAMSWIKIILNFVDLMHYD